MPFEITVVREFSASHQLRLYDGSLEPLHGHNWRVLVTVAAPRLDRIGVVMDFHELQRMVDEIIRPMHNRHLNDVPTLGVRNPSAENVAAFIAESLRLSEQVKLVCVEVRETDDCRAVWRAS
jgi:6-pyruvoyltetrahydropterin/6-carboxytetrahydropterin synthase